MFSSDDSLFEEWTRQMEDNNKTDTTNNKWSTTNPVAMAIPMTSSNQNTDTLPDIVLSNKKSGVVTGLLMLRENLENIDDEVNN